MQQPRGRNFRALIRERQSAAAARVALDLTRVECALLEDLIHARLDTLTVVDREDRIQHARLIGVRRKLIEACA